jgi:hypothetical protein
VAGVDLRPQRAGVIAKRGDFPSRFDRKGDFRPSAAPGPAAGRPEDKLRADGGRGKGSAVSIVLAAGVLGFASMPRDVSKSAKGAGPTRLRVAPTNDGWQVRREDSNRVTGVYGSQSEATEAAKAALRNCGGELRVQGRDGRVRQSVTLGRNPMAKVAAVEGIFLTPRMKQTLADMDRSGLSGEERRQAIARQFGKKA